MLLAPLIVSVTACAKNGSVISYCDVAKPIYFSGEDKVSRRTENAIIAHDETWEKLCK